MQIPLAREAHADQLVWVGEPSGEFSVRSAYALRILMRIQYNLRLKNFTELSGGLEIPSKLKITVADFLELHPHLYQLELQEDWCENHVPSMCHNG